MHPILSDISRFRDGAASEQFTSACAGGDLDALVAVLHHDVTGEFDSGGFIPGAPLAQAAGPRKVAALLHSAFSTTPATFEVDLINGEPGVLITIHAHLVATIALEVRDGRIAHVHGVGNPHKLRQRH